MFSLHVTEISQFAALTDMKEFLFGLGSFYNFFVCLLFSVRDTLCIVPREKISKASVATMCHR